MRPRVLTVGETMTLVAPADARPLEEATAFRLDIGGAESNVACHLVRLGIPTAWAGAVGDDATGRRLLAMLRARGVDLSAVRVDAEAPTGLYLKDPQPDGTRVIYHRRGSAASRLDAGFLDEPVLARLLAEAEIVHITGITPALGRGPHELIAEILRRRRTAGRMVSFDVNYRAGLWDVAAAAPVLHDLAEAADLVFVGRDEAETLWGVGDVEGIRRILPSGRLVIKDGAVAAHCFDERGHRVVPSLPVEVVEPVGAGDAFAAGFLAAQLDGAGAEAALLAGHRSAAVTLTSVGDV